MVEWRIEETTLARIDGWKVAVGNIWEREYKDAEGNIRKGPVARLSIVGPGSSEATPREVGAGSVVSLGEAGTFLVAEVVVGQGSTNGYVVLRKK